MLRPTILAIPIFALLIAVEAYLTRRAGRSDYPDAKDAWNNIILGFGSIVWGDLWAYYRRHLHILLRGRTV